MERDTRKGLILALCCAAQFMVVLDIAIVNVALPSIKRDLGLSEGGLEWIVIAYGLMLGGFFMVNCENLDEAIEAASRIPAVEWGASIEVRPIQEFPSKPS